MVYVNNALNNTAKEDFTVTSATAAVDRKLTVSNTDNSNAASAATIIASTGGASAGDAKFQASTTTTTWSFGADNSATSPTVDPFVISQGTALGTNNCIVVGTSGTVSKPLQPAFRAYLGSTASNVTGDGTVVQLGVGTADLTEEYDQGTNFDPTNGTFTAPVTGIYHIGGSVNFGELGAGNTAGGMYFYNSTTPLDIAGFVINTATTRQIAANNLVLTLSCDCKLTAGDAVTMNVYIENGTKVVDIMAVRSSTYFYGHLVC